MKRAGIWAGVLLSGFIGAGTVLGATGASVAFAADESVETVNVNEQVTPAAVDEDQISDTQQETKESETSQTATGEEHTGEQETTGSDAGNDAAYRDEEKDSDTSAVNLQEENVSLKSSKDTAKPEETLKTENAPRLMGGVGATRSVQGDIRSISFDRTSAVPGDKVSVTVELNSVINSDYLYLGLINGDKTQSVYLSKASDGKYKGSEKIDNTWMNGKWSVSGINYFDSDARQDVYLDLTGVALPALTVSGSLEDNQGPVVKSVKFDKNEYKAGDTINITVTAEDVSGVSGGTIYIMLGDDESETIYLEKQSDTVLTGSIKTDNTWKNGTYNIEIQIYDTLGNDIDYVKALYDWQKDIPDRYVLISSLNINLPVIKLSGSTQDREGPVVKKVTFDKKEYKPGDTVTVTIDAEDPAGFFSGRYSDYAGGWHRAGEIRVTDSDGNEHESEIRLDDAGIIKGKFKVTNAWKNGKYKVNYLRLFDEFNHVSDYSVPNDNGYIYGKNISEISASDFSVSGSTQDLKPPVVTAINIDKTNVKPGDVITVTANVTDQTGTNSINIELSPIKNEDDYEYQYKYQKEVRIHKNADGSFKGTLKVDDSWANGTYRLYRVYATDDLGNSDLSDYYYGETQDTDKITCKDIVVSGSKETYDDEGPVVTTMKFDKSSVKPGDTVKVTAEATDTSGVKEIIVSLVNENDSGNGVMILEVSEVITVKTKKVVLLPDGSGKFTGELKIDEGWKNGKYTVEFVDAYDVLGNASDHWGGKDINRDEWLNKKELYGISLNVSSSKADAKGPVVKSITVDKDTVRPGEELFVTITLDDKSGISTYIPKLSLYTRDFYWFSASGHFDLISGNKILCKMTIDKAVTPGTYSLGELIVKDLVGNVSYYVSDLIKQDYFKIQNNKDEYGIIESDIISLDPKDIIEIKIVDSTGEFNGPEIKALKLDKQKAKQYTDTVTFTATLADSSNLDFVNVSLKKDTHATADGNWVKLKKQSDGTVKGEITPDGSWEPGTYYVSGLYAVDKNGERFEVGYDRTNTDKKVEDVIIGSDRFEVVKNDISITLDKKLLVLDKGKTGKLTATITPATVKDKTVTWSSSDTNVATVDANGNVKAVNSGSAVITAKAVSGKAATCEVRVNFADVASTGLYYYKPVYWAAENKITTGANGLFAPHNSCTREHAITFLWRMAGSPQPKSMVSKFKDIQNKNSYSYNAILWASEKGITTGANGEFKPGKTCTRAEIVTFIYRYKNTVK